MKHPDKPSTAKQDSSTTGNQAGSKSRPARSRKPARKQSFAAFLRSIPPGDAFDEQDFARIQ